MIILAGKNKGLIIKMNYFKKVFLTVLIFLLLISNEAITSSEGLTVAELLEKIDQKDTEILDIKFNFSQNIKITLTKEEYKIFGSAIYKKPNKIYLKTLADEKNLLPEQVVVSDGEKIWIYTPKYKQVIVEKWSAKGGLSKYRFVPEEIFNYVDSVKKLAKNYELEYPGKVNGSFLLSLKPKKRKEIKINFYISADTYLPLKTELLAETVEVITEIKDIEINTKIKDEIFHFHPPEDVNVLSFD